MNLSDFDSTAQAAYFNHLGCDLYKKRDFQKALVEFQKALMLNPDLWEAEYNLAHCLVQQEDMKQAAIYYHHVLEKVPDHANAHFNLGMIYTNEKDYKNAIHHLHKSLEHDPAQPEIQEYLGNAYHNLAILCLREGNRDQALHHFKEALKQQSNNETAQYMTAALQGETHLSEAPQNYIIALFDQYAEYYDQHVNTALNYQAPRLLYHAFLKCLADNAPQNKYHILDLGCGTGLCGQYFHALAKRLVGVDLSSKMLEKAKMTGKYDLLLCNNLHTELELAADTFPPFDIILASDVLVYVGDLEPVFLNCVKALPSKGYFGFTIEENVSNDFQIQPTGRYSHSRSYIQNLAKKHQLHILLEEPIPLRIEQGKPALGCLFILNKG